MAPPFAQQTKKTTTQSSTSGGPPGLTSSRRAGPPAPPGKSRDQIAKELDREITRRTYFDGRQDVSDDRLDRRLVQAQEEKAFISTLKPVEGTGGTLLQEQAPVFNPRTGRYERTTLADKRIQLANKYGPTFGELASDMGYAFGSMAKGAGDILQSGRFGLVGIIKDVANYAFNKTNEDYDKLNDVEKEVFENPNKYPYASKMPRIGALDSTRQLMLEAERDALGLELDTLMAEREFRYNNPTVDMRKPTREGLEAIDIDDSYVESGQFKSDLEKSGIITVDDPSTQEPLPDATKIPGTESTLGDFKQALENQGFDQLQINSAVNEITRQIIAGEYTGDFDVEVGKTTVEPKEVKEKSEISVLGAFNPLDDIPTGMAINELLNPEQQDLGQFKKEMDQGFIDDQASLSTAGGTQVTAYNNPGNLQFAGQSDAIEGQTYGNNFAVFPNAEAGINALRADLTAKVNRNNAVDKIIGEYAPKEDNPESFNNYLSFVKERVGETVEPNEIDDLTRSVIQFENKPKIANQYLAMVADGGMIDKRLKNLQNGLQNMYNGIPSVSRR